MRCSISAGDFLMYISYNWGLKFKQIAHKSKGLCLLQTIFKDLHTLKCRRLENI